MTMKNNLNDEWSAAWRTPIGPMTARVSPRGVRMLHFPEPGEQILDEALAPAVELAEVRGPNGETSPDGAPPQLEALTAFLTDYFAGRPAGALPGLDFSRASSFDRAVWEATLRIPRGATMTYGQLAAALGRPGAARAVGGALGRNPLVLLVPCHRVIASAGGARALCGFTGGLGLKRRLLALEGLHFALARA